MTQLSINISEKLEVRLRRAADQAGTTISEVASRLFDANLPDDDPASNTRSPAEFERALENGELELWFQPKVRLSTGRIVGAEGLARWRHPTEGIVMPDDFIGELSSSTHQHQFSSEMLRQAIRFASQCAHVGHPMTYAVNMSVAAFFNVDLPRQIKSLLAEYAVPASHIMIEITEADVLDTDDLPVTIFDEIAALGVGLSIDDFGTGYSSLERLRKLPVTEMKIDRSFVSRLDDPEDFIIVRTTIDLATLLGHQSVAEGVETARQAQMLEQSGCDLAQGWLFSHAIPANDFIALLEVDADLRELNG